MPLTTRDKRHLRSLAHHLEPAVRVGGKGVSAGVLAQVDAALSARELVKVRIDGDRDDVREASEALASGTGAEVAQVIGKIVLLYRPAKEREKRKITLPSRE